MSEDTTAQESTSEGQGQKTSPFQSVRDLIERTFFAGMGAAALTKDKIQDLADELVKRGQLTTDEGRELVKDWVSRSKSGTGFVLQKADSSLQGVYKEVGLATRKQLEDMEFRLSQVEHRLSLLEGEADSKETTDE